ncbi:MAG: AAA family ATPase, partial [Polynucleobacter sp.]|nr:AAA family ATPase [Polynucleobacter sp.]
MHRIAHIAIKNFRLCRDVSLPLEGFTPLVGQNNTGKSSILAALSWVLKPSALAATDFSDSRKPVEICAKIDGITGDILDLLPEQKHRKAIEPFCANGYLWIRVTATGAGTKAIKQEVYDFEKYSGTVLPTEWREYPT